jgi:multidrug resistance efflux pump
MKKWLMITMGLLLAHPAWSGELVLQALMGGQVVQQKVRAGETVKAGQLLLVIDPARWQARVAGAKAQVKARQAELEDARLDLAEAEDLYERTVLSKRALQRAQKKVRVAEAALAQARAVFL